MVEGKGTHLLFCGQRNAFLCLETILKKNYEHLFKGFKCKLTLMYSNPVVSRHITKPTTREK